MRMVHTLRRAKSADAQALAALAPNAGDPFADGALTIVAENEQGEISGYCTMAFPSRDPDADPTVCEVAALYVHPERLRWGIGRALMRSALDKAAGDGYEAVTVWLTDPDGAARKFFESFGFKPDGVTQRDGGGPQQTRLRLTLL